MPEDNAKTARALMEHMLHELLRIQTDIDACHRYFDYIATQSGHNPADPQFVTPVALDVARRAVGESVAGTRMWLDGQVIGLRCAGATTEDYFATKGTPPQRGRGEHD